MGHRKHRAESRTVPSDDVSRYCRNVSNGHRAAHSLCRLRQLNISLEQYRRYRVKSIAQRHLSSPGLTEASRRLLEKIQRMELEEERSASAGRGESRKRHQETRREDSGRSAVAREERRMEPAKREPITSRRPSEEPRPPVKAPEVGGAGKVDSIQKPSGLLDVSQIHSIPESDYERVRPSLIYLSARELKDFMDRNPKIEAIADGLFRRHCQMDCPEEMWRKPVMYSKWRTLHDVFNNWKMFEEQLGLETIQ